MEKIKLGPKQIRWILTGFGILILVGAGLLLSEELERQVRLLANNILGQDTRPHLEQSLMSMGGMTTPAEKAGGPAQAFAMVTSARQQLIGLKTGAVENRQLEMTIRAVGRVDFDERRLAHVNFRLSGWVEELFVDYTGQRVRKGHPLFTLYSPDLVAAQDEYLLAVNAYEQVQDSPLSDARDQARQLVEAAYDRLRLWTLTDKQIQELSRRGKSRTSVTFFSPIGGYVIEKKVFKGMFVEPRMTAYTIADLSTIWIQAEIYEYEVPFVKGGESATLTLDAYPGETFGGRVTYLYPYLNKETRTLKVRLEFPNPTLRLKPGMFGTVSIRIQRKPSLAVPEDAVMDSGIRTVVFVVREKGMFEPRQVTLGPKVGSYYEVIDGLKEGERIVTSGNFLLDSESKLMASTNMMGALGMGGIKMEQAHMGEMEMGGMDMGGMGMDRKVKGNSHDRTDH